MALILQDIRDDLLRKLYFERPEQATPGALADVLGAINGALQQMWQSPEDFFKRTEETVALVAGTSSYELPATVQRILAPAVLSGGKRLTPLAYKYQWFEYGALFAGATDQSFPKDTPEAFFLDRQAGGTVRLLVVPEPVDAEVLKIEAEHSAPAYETADLTTAIEPPIPHKYAETLFLPIARWRITRSHYFMNQEALPGLQQDYAEALAVLGLADPQIEPLKKRKAREEAAEGEGR